MAGTLEERLRLVVDASTGSAESEFGKLSTSAERSATAVDSAAESVALAADRVAIARAKEADAAGKLSVAEAKLAEARTRYGEQSSQVVAAEERVAAAQRQVQIATAQTTAALEQQNVVNEAAPAAAERSARGAGKVREQLGELKGLATGLVAFGLADWLSESVQGFLEGARGAQSLATSMNAPIEQAGQLSVLFQQMGLESDDLLEIQAQFAQTTVNGMTAVGTEVKKNNDGTVNWASTLVDSLETLQKVPDATERNRLGFAAFGEEGYKQLSRLITSGVSVEDALKQIGTPFSQADIDATHRYDAAMRDLSINGADLGRTVARDVVPILSTLTGVLSSVLGVVSEIPLPLTLAATAAVVMGRTGFDPLSKAADFVRDRFAALNKGVAAATSGVEEGAGRMARAGAIAKGGVSGLTDALGGPLGVALIAASALFAVASAGEQSLEDHARTAAAEVERLGGTTNDAAANTRRLAQQMDENAGYWERVGAAGKGLNSEIDKSDNWFLKMGRDLGIVNTGLASLAEGANDGEVTQEGFRQAIEEARKELGEYGAQQTATQITTDSLNELIAQGDTSSKAFADAVRDAANAQNDQTKTSDTAAAAIAAYHSQTDGASAAVLGLINAQLSQQDAGYAFLQAMDQLNAATDDAKTSVDEVAQAHTALQEAALRAGGAAADAAVQQAKAAGTIVTPLDEAKLRADTLITDLTARLNTPGLSKGAQDDLQGLIDQLTTARDKGDVNALVTLTGVDAAQGDLDETTKDREAHVNVESRGGPAVVDYLDGIAGASRLALIKVESRGGPDVDRYLDGLSVNRDRLAIIRVESRGGPAVDSYLDGLARERLSIIRVETRGGPAVDDYLNRLARDRNATINATRGSGGVRGSGVYGAPSVGAGAAPTVMLGSVTLDLELTGAADRAQLSRAERGRARVEEIRAYERDNGTGWRR